MAQWKRAGPITQRSEDQNFALLVFLLLLKRMSEDVLLPSLYLFFIIEVKEMQRVTSSEECAQQKYRSAIYGLINVLVSESEKLSF